MANGRGILKFVRFTYKTRKTTRQYSEWKDVRFFVTNQCIWKNVCHWNSMNPNNKLKDTKEVLVNEVSPPNSKRFEWLAQ